MKDSVLVELSLETICLIQKLKPESLSVDSFLNLVLFNKAERDEKLIDIICDAILDKKLLKFRYRFTDYRIVEPYFLGVDYNGKTKLSAYQIEGYSESSTPQGWKTFIVDKIDCIEIVNRHFEIREDYNPSGYKDVVLTICEVEMFER